MPPYRMAVWFAVLSAIACYSPRPPMGAPCGADGACPTGQTCDAQAGVCVGPGGPIVDASHDGTPSDGPADAPVDSGADAPPADAMPDARPIDAMPDGPPDVGCADGEREAFVDASDFPTLAGCAANWPEAPSLRAPRTGAACGDDLGECEVPASACSPGWHVCGDDGSFDELAAIAPEACETAAPAGRFVAALSHCTNNVGVCEYDDQLPCFDDGFCSEPVCCGPDCLTPGCTSGVWPDRTHSANGAGSGCNAFASEEDLGVLCCKLP